MNRLEHIAISASAGSGKTYALTNRFISLLHLTEQPERIIALTFTRTAAGEFFHKIIQKLCDAASDERKAASLSAELTIDADPKRYRKLLRMLVDSMHQLNLQTLDSFFFRVVSAFSLELGLSGTLNLLDETSAPRIRNEVRDGIVHRPSAMNAELNEFWHAFKQATYGQEARSIESTIANFIEGLYSLYLAAPRQETWGNPDQIWQGPCPWQVNTSPNWEQLANNLRASLPEGLGKAQVNDFESAAKHVANYPIDEKLNTLLNNAFASATEIFQGNATIKVRKALQLDETLCAALSDILKAILWHHLHRALQNTQGVYRILNAYNENYDRLVRRPGRLAFADLIHLLSPDTEGSPVGSVELETRQLMDFRLDGQYDHWLFDEFQDTSRPQWEVVENLIDEIVQDDSGTRSLFYVGDTKQCLYLWRSSDDRLFHDIIRSYPTIKEQTLATSWRSAPAILDAVNAVFADEATITNCFSANTAERWARAWNPHHASSATKSLGGYACWLHCEKDEGLTRNRRILDLLTELQPIERGLSVGILVRKNSDANEIAEFLRENSNIPAHTGSAIQPAKDNAAGVALLSMLKVAAHPGDTHAAGFLRLIDCSTAGASLFASCAELRDRLLTDSNESAIRWATDVMREHLPKDDIRHAERLKLLVEKARAFDQEDRRDIDSLIEFLENSISGECSQSDAVIIETIHKSKGLEYDIVLLVNEDKSKRSERRISPLLDSNGKANWILEPIKKELMEADPKLHQLHEQAEGQQDFGSLCTLYVGMTRAKRGLYMLSDFYRVSKGSTVAFLREQLGDEPDADGILWQTGDSQWYQSIPKTLSEPENETLEIQSAQFEPAHPRLTLARPSKDKSAQINLGQAFDLNQDATDFGTAVHEAFEQIEWFDSDNLPDTDFGSDRVKATLGSCFENNEICSLFTRQKHVVELWREKAFSLIDGDKLINGVFDRVHLHRNSEGQITRAEIIDFKTDRIHSGNTITRAVEHHRPQMESYRRALVAITGLDAKQIALRLLFTSSGQLASV